MRLKALSYCQLMLNCVWNYYMNCPLGTDQVISRRYLNNLEKYMQSMSDLNMSKIMRSMRGILILLNGVKIIRISILG